MILQKNKKKVLHFFLQYFIFDFENDFTSKFINVNLSL